MASPTILLTGFEPFDGASSNPSWMLAEALHGKTIGGAKVHAVQLPCVFGRSLQELEHAVRSKRPALVLALGLAAGRADLSLERVAINVDDARIADNAGAQPVDLPVVAGAPAAYFSSLPIKAMVRQMNAAGVPASVSQTAGTFVCNHVFFGLMHLLRRRRSMRAGFMHVPSLLPEAGPQGMPGLDWACQRTGLEVALQTAMTTARDEPVAGGALY